MKEATGEGSMTIVTIVVIVLLLAAATAIVGFLVTRTNQKSNEISSETPGVECTEDANHNVSCTKKS